MTLASSALIGCVLLVLTKCLNMEETYRAIEWNVIFLLAGVITLGIAMEKTGAALILSEILVSTVGQWGPVAVISALFFLTMMLTNVMSNAPRPPCSPRSRSGSLTRWLPARDLF